MVLSAQRIAYLFTLPIIIFLLTFSVFPLIFSIYVSFYAYELYTPGSERDYVGLRNYIKILFSPYSNFWTSLTITGFFMAMVISVEFFFGLGLALLLSKEIKGKNIVRSIVTTPLAISPIVAALIWRLIFNPQFGVLNFALGSLRLGERTWLDDPRTALPSAAIVDIWQWTPFVFLILLAGLLAMEREPYEAALIDGASPWQLFRHITLPLLKSHIVIALLFRTVDSFKTFDMVFSLTHGGPAGATELLSILTYKTGFKFSSMGEAAASSWLMLAIISVFSSALMKSLGKEVRL